MSLRSYYISRLIISVILGVIIATSGAPWWAAVIAGLVAFSFFVWAPFSGRYALHPERGITALQRDERTQVINDKAARNAFVITMLALGAIDLYFGSMTPGNIPSTFLHYTLILGVITYFLSDLWLRRTA